MPIQPSLSPAAVTRLNERYAALLKESSHLGPISQGSVMHTPPRAWRWTRKVKAKTVSVALSANQAAAMQQAIANERRMNALIDEMREITQKLILEAEPGPRRRPKRQNPKQVLS
jgi:hypothetical protein